MEQGPARPSPKSEHLDPLLKWKEDSREKKKEKKARDRKGRG